MIRVLPRKGSVGVEGPEGVEGSVTKLEVGLAHQGSELEERRRLIGRGHRLQGERAKLGLLGRGLGQDLGHRAIIVVEVGESLGGEEADRVVGRSQPLGQCRRGVGAESLRA